MSPKQVFKAAVTATSTTVGDLGTAGDLRYEPDGTIYKLVKAGATIANGAACAASSVSGAEITVGLAGATNKAAGFNNTGGSIASGTFFFMIVSGKGSVLSAGAYSAGDQLACQASGKVDTWAATDAGVSAQALEAATAADQVKAALITCL